MPKQQPKAVWAYNPDLSKIGTDVDLESFDDPDDIKTLVREGRIRFEDANGEHVEPGPSLPGGGPVATTDVPGEQRKAQAKAPAGK